MDEKWKLSKKAGCRNSSSSRSSTTTTTTTTTTSLASDSSSSSLPKARMISCCSNMSSQRSFTDRCTSLAREQRAKFYIMRRCVTMLICWTD